MVVEGVEAGLQMYLWHAVGHDVGVEGRYREGVGAGEVERRDGIEFSQRLTHGGLKYLPDGLVVLEFDFRLGGMYVDVETRGLHFHIEEEGHLHAFGHKAVEGGLHGLGEIGMAHEAVVGEEKLRCCFLLGALGRSHKAIDAHQRGLDADGEQLALQPFAKETADAAAEGAGGQIVEDGVLVVQDKGDVHMGQREPLKLGQDVGHLGLVALEELASRGDIEEDVAHGEVGPYAASHGLLFDNAAALDAHARTHFLFGSARFEFDLRHCGYRGQGFATETHCVEVEEVGSLANL